MQNGRISEGGEKSLVVFESVECSFTSLNFLWRTVWIVLELIMNYLVANAQNTSPLESFENSGLNLQSLYLNFAQRIISENMNTVFSGRPLDPFLMGLRGSQSKQGFQSNCRLGLTLSVALTACETWSKLTHFILWASWSQLVRWSLWWPYSSCTFRGISVTWSPQHQHRQI